MERVMATDFVKLNIQLREKELPFPRSCFTVEQKGTRKERNKGVGEN